MSKITNRMAYKRFAKKGRTMLQVMNSTFLEHSFLLDGAPFRYRAPHANRPTSPRKRFIG